VTGEQAGAVAGDAVLVDGLLRAVVAVTGMELAYLAALDAETFTFRRLATAGSPWPGLSAGVSSARSDSFCGRMLAGAPPWTLDAASDPAYRDAGQRQGFGITSYVGVPVGPRDADVVMTLCGADRASVPVGGRELGALGALAGVVADAMATVVAQPDGVPTLVRTVEGWRVTGLPVPDPAAAVAGDLPSAMVLADLLAEELGHGTGRGSRPGRPEAPADEVERLRAAVAQLEHALAARVVVEQAIGVLVERRRVQPRQAFEALRGVARGSGRRVHDLAREVVASGTLPGVALPPSLARVGASPAVPSPADVAGRISRGASGR